MAVFCISAFAEPVSESEARKTALSLLKSELSSSRLKSGNKLTSENLTLIKVKKDGNTPLYYVYNAEDDGFVIVSGVKETAPILAYGLEGGIDINNLPDGAKAMLKSYAAAMKKAAADPSIYKTKANTETKEDIERMTTALWNQKAPYYGLTKLKRVSSDDSAQCITGCPATATSILMKYYHDKNGWFKSSAGIPGYRHYSTSVKDSLIVDSLPPITFDWENCNYSYDDESSETAKLAVAQVMRYSGQAERVKYDTGNTGSNEIEIVRGINQYLTGDDNFEAVLFDKYFYPDKDWWNLIYYALQNIGPVNIGGLGSAGHSFVCEGYKQIDGEDYYYINWGWSGNGNGYCHSDSLISISRPGGTPSNFNNKNAVILYLTPENKEKIESLGWKIYDYGVDDIQILFDSVVNTFNCPIIYEYEGKKENNCIKILPSASSTKLNKIKAIPSVKIMNIKTKESMIYRASENEVTVDFETRLNFNINLSELKEKMIANGLGTDGIYEMKPKMSDDEDKDDYFSETNVYSYFFKFSDNADTLKIIPPVIIDEYNLSERGIDGMTVHYTVAPELQDEEVYLSTTLNINKNYISGGASLGFHEQVISENDTEGYIEFDDLSEKKKNLLAGKREYTVKQYNGLPLYTFDFTSMGMINSITQVKNFISEDNDNATLKSEFDSTENFRIYDVLQGNVSYSDDEERWIFDSLCTRYNKAIMTANDDNSRITHFLENESRTLTSEKLNKKITSYYNSLVDEGKKEKESITIVRDSLWNDSVGYLFSTSYLLDKIKNFEEKKGTGNLYRIVTTVDTAGYIMPADGLYYSNYFKTSDDYSEIIFFSPVEVPEDKGPEITVTKNSVSVTLKPVDGLSWVKTALTMSVYSDADYSHCLWTGGGKCKLTSEGTVSVSGKNISLEEGQTYYYRIVNHDGILIYEGSSAPTAINEVNTESDNSNSTAVKYNGKRYNLAGQEVDDNYNGIVIMNGKKIIEN